MFGIFDADDMEGWRDNVREAAICLRSAYEDGMRTGAFTPEDLDHRRGLGFLAIPVGVSMGGGQERPGNLFHHLHARRVVSQAILRNPAIKRIAACFAMFAPKLHRLYKEVLGDLFDTYPHLERNFSNSVFPAVSFNCGPASVCIDHADFNNLSFGLCLITALGDFDYKTGGHVVLHGIKKVIELPPGSTLAIPSSLEVHSNTGIKPSETRYSITQYAAGGLFRWIAYDGVTAKKLLSTKAGKKKKSAADGPEGQRWADGLSLYSTMESWAQDHEDVKSDSK
ncbi:hypothetical protein DFP72DRAFT_806676 [Ephemerocybe angulata]|uniref:Uncharacterized protein n=1 Tax=Ephemerocybe angulata TaxID=980116 RepID=A0A8H6I8E8_9AGAR|nr:hypothetical protein DFP72DRAFT_806676 [Tulosesus angulatus]